MDVTDIADDLDATAGEEDERPVISSRLCRAFGGARQLVSILQCIEKHFGERVALC